MPRSKADPDNRCYQSRRRNLIVIRSILVFVEPTSTRTQPSVSSPPTSFYSFNSYFPPLPSPQATNSYPFTISAFNNIHHPIQGPPKRSLIFTGRESGAASLAAISIFLTRFPERAPPHHWPALRGTTRTLESRVKERARRVVMHIVID
jgi:hypothetical protein